jgi:hypothetical protein
MGISMAICELDSTNSLCKVGKETILKARLPSVQGYEAAADYDEVIQTDDAKKAFAADWEGFLKRNRLDGEKESFLLEKVKKDEDAAKLRPVAQKVYTGWINLTKLPPAQAQEVIKQAGPDNIMTQWDTVPLDETNVICGKCGMSWDKGRGCIGSFGPDNSQLPEIAKKYGLTIVARIPELAQSREKLSAADAKKLAEECKVLKEKLPMEGKGPAHRYGGVVERMEQMANLCAQNGMRFYFL